MQIKQIHYLFLIIIFSFSNSLLAQVDYMNLTGAKKGQVDTLTINNLEKFTKDKQGLLDFEIDPSKYTVGAGDEFEIQIVNMKLLKFKERVSPEGNLSLPDIGMISLKGLTLEAAYSKIKDKVQKTYNQSEVSISLSNIKEFKVSVSGLVQKSTLIPASAADRVSEVIDKVGGAKPLASMRNIFILRGEKKEKIKVDLVKYYFTADIDKNPYVMGGDHIIVPQINESETISIEGEVLTPGTYEFAEHDKLSDLVKFSHGFLESSKLDSVVLVRVNLSSNELDRFILDLRSWKDNLYISTNLKGDLELKPGDRLFVRKMDNWQEDEYIMLVGEIKYPGKYAIRKGKDKLFEVLRRAGGFTEFADLNRAEYIRQSELRKKDPELERLQRLNPSEMSDSELRYYQAKVNEKKGSMAIDLSNVIKDPSSNDNIYIVNMDSLVVPSKNLYVNVQGRINNPGQVLYRADFTYMDYINLAGGIGYRADVSETLVTKSKGEQFLAEDLNYKIEPGDLILVPPEKEISSFELFTTALTIVAQLVTIAGVVIAVTNSSK